MPVVRRLIPPGVALGAVFGVVLGVVLTPWLAGCDPLGPEGPEWEAIRSLAAIEDLVPPPDFSNARVGDARAEALGQKLYFDPDFSGRSTLIDMLGRTVPLPPGRAAKGEPIRISCATCHDPARGGTDHTSLAAVSIGAGAYDVSAQATVNAAFNQLWYWNGRNDSLWSQIIAVTESPVSMGGNRLRVLWRIADVYREEYQAIFGELPVPGTVAAQRQRLLLDGRCKPAANGTCPTASCVERLTGTSSAACVPRFPLEGRPGSVEGCQLGDSREPFGDAFDCMEDADREATTRVFVHFAKAIAAYEYRLISQRSAFDRWVRSVEIEREDGDQISGAAKRGARLFVSKASCIECHNTPLLSDGGFHDLAVPQDGDFVPTEDACVEGLARCDCVAGKSCLPWGLFDGLKKLQANGFRRDSRWSDDPSDASRQRFYALDLTTADASSLKGRWKTPSLRDVAITAPYMHTGRYRTLRDVLEHYNWGGHPSDESRDPKAVPLGLTDEEIDDLIAFLETLTGEALPDARVESPELPAPTAF